MDDYTKEYSMTQFIFKIKNEFSDIRIFNDIRPLINIVGDWKTYLFRFFRWSNNGLEYSEWIDISDNLDVFSDLCIYLRPKFFIDVKFTLKDVESNIGITDLKIDVEYNNIPKEHKPFSILYDALEEQTFKPVEQYTASNFYLNQNEAIDFWKKVMFQNQDIFVIPIKYIRANSGLQYSEGAVYLKNAQGEKVGRGFLESTGYADGNAQMLKLAGIPATPEMLKLLEPRTLSKEQVASCAALVIENKAALDQE